MIFIFLWLLGPALRALEGGSKNPLDHLALWIAAPLDVFIAHTTFALVFGWPKRGEWTISQSLERIVSEHKHPRWLLAAAMAKEINKESPTGKHIKAMA